MNKRNFLKSTAFFGLAGVLRPASLLQASPAGMPTVGVTVPRAEAAFKVDPLPYPADALAPHIDAKTMQLHHDKHYQGYTDKLNSAIAGTKYAQMPIEEILRKVGKDEKAIRNNGGGYYNHSLFWKWMAPNAGGQPTGALADAINSAFGSYSSFKEKFSTAASDVFGSGWAWLLADQNGKLSIGSTPNQDNPLMSFAESQGKPVLGLDVWEHAYYLKYQNKRAEYIQAFWNVVNWPQVSQLYAAK